jgi:hypothetical protein
MTALLPTAVEVRVATTPEEREAVFRFRYRVYVEELGRYRAIADHRRRRLADAEDDHSWVVYALVDGDVVGTTRVTWGGDSFSERQVEQYQLAPFLAEIPAERMAVGERTMISPHLRGADLFPVLTQPCEALTMAHDVRVVFGACEPHLLSLYAEYQRPYGTRNINSPEAGFLVPLISFPQGPDALRELGSPGRLPRCVQAVLAGTGTVESPGHLGDEAYGALVVEALTRLVPSVFDGMGAAELAACLRRSNVITCRTGDRLLKAGGSARNAFVVLDGRLTVSRCGDVVGTVGPGEVVGEMAYLLQQPRGFDVDVVTDGTRVLSLSERTLARLPDTDPTAAAKLVSNISRQLCRRLEHGGPGRRPGPSRVTRGRVGEIRTPDLCVPNAALYQAEPPPVGEGSG